MTSHITEIWAGSLSGKSPSGVLEALQPDEMFAIAANDKQGLVVGCRNNEHGIYSVKRNGPGVNIPEAEKWNLHTDQVELRQGGAVTGLLLGPSLLGEHLYGAAAEPEGATERFGSISLVYDKADKAHLVHVSMPMDLYRGIGGLIILRPDTLSTPPPHPISG